MTKAAKAMVTQMKMYGCGRWFMMKKLLFLTSITESPAMPKHAGLFDGYLV
jgi:hypothetical protein